MYLVYMFYFTDPRYAPVCILAAVLTVAFGHDFNKPTDTHEAAEIIRSKALKEIIAKGDYCTQDTQSSCKIGGYSVLTPEAKSIADMLDSKNIDEFIPSESCVRDRFLEAKIKGEIYRFCEVNRLPTSYSLEKKMKLIRKEPRK